MAKEKAITIDGTIKETLPNAMFRVDVEIGGDSHTVLAHVTSSDAYVSVAHEARDLW